MLPERMLYRFRDLVKHNWQGVDSEEDVMNLVCTYRIVVQIHIQEGHFFYTPELENALEKHLPDMILTVCDPGHVKNIDFTNLRNVVQKDTSSIQIKECFYPTAAVPEDTMLKWLFAGTREFSCLRLDTGTIYGGETPKCIFKIDPGKPIEPQEIVINIDDLIISREEIAKFERELQEEQKEHPTDIDKNSRSKNGVNKREERNDLRVIAALKTIIMEQTSLKSQEDIYSFITNDNRFKHVEGLKQKTLEMRFKKANVALEDALKDAGD